MREVGRAVEGVGPEHGTLARRRSAALLGHHVEAREPLAKARHEQGLGGPVIFRHEVDGALVLDLDARVPPRAEQRRRLTRDVDERV